MNEIPTIIRGDHFIDDRGSLRFVNGFDFDQIKRFYLIKHPDISLVRAWQGHQFEKKFFFPITGKFIVAWVRIDDFKNPSKELKPEYHIIDSKISEIVIIPKGYANGLKALEPNSEIMVFSDLNLTESISEKIRYPSNWWLDWSKNF